MPFCSATMRMRSGNCGWLWRKSADMDRHALLAGSGKEFLRPYGAIVLSRSLQTDGIKIRGALLHARQHFFLALGKPVQVVHEIDEQKLRAQLTRKGRPDAEVECPATQRKQPVSLVIIDDGLVVKLGRTDP